MRHGGFQGLRSRMRWLVLVATLLLVCVYLAFDVLDLDGSDLVGTAGRAILAAESVETASDRLLGNDPFSPTALLPPPPLVDEGRAGIRVRHLTAHAAWRAIQHIRILARANLGRHLLALDSPTTDPA